MNPITGTVLTKYVLPSGHGPTAKDMEEVNYATITAQGIGSKGSKVECVLYFSKDIGYKETARMLVESGLAMAWNEDQLPTTMGGFWTPSTGIGTVLLDRLVQTGTHYASRIIPRDASTD